MSTTLSSLGNAEASRWKKNQKDTHHTAEKPESIDKESFELSAVLLDPAQLHKNFTRTEAPSGSIVNRNSLKNCLPRAPGSTTALQQCQSE